MQDRRLGRKTRVIVEFRHADEHHGLQILARLIPALVRALRVEAQPLPVVVRIERDQ